MLEAEGIPSAVFNEHMASVAGGMPFQSTVPEIWVRTEDAARADRLVQELEKACQDQPISDVRSDPDAICIYCSYPLYGLPDRRCPECGAEF